MQPQPSAVQEQKSGATRSPAFPFINLETALRRAKEFYGEQQHHAAPVKLRLSFGYQEKAAAVYRQLLL